MLRGLLDRVIVFAILVVLIFFLPRLLPGDPLQLLLATDVTRALSPDEIEMLRAQYGLSGSWPEQFMRYLGALSRGDLGFSLRHATPVIDLLAGAIP